MIYASLLVLAINRLHLLTSTSVMKSLWPCSDACNVRVSLSQTLMTLQTCHKMRQHLRVVRPAYNEATSLVKLDVENGRDFVSREVCVAKHGFHASKLAYLRCPVLLARRIELLAELGTQLHGQILGALTFLVDVLAANKLK
jgi:hypothetical protein